ncbi:MAG TPA: hypothetical protein VK891_13280, partial [Euzebyales bacterium]|nr:hypothetical protein [Euzebyales bacterium]
MTSAGAVRRRAAAACLVAVRGLVICALVCVVVGVWAPAARAEEVGTSPLEQITNDGQLEDTDAIPWNRYNIEAETDFGLTNLGGIGDVLWWSFTDLLFALTRLVTVFGIWLVEWAYSFRIVDLARGPAVNVAERLDDDIVGPLGLGDFAVFLAVFYSGYKLLRRQTGLGVSELVTSLVIAVLGAVVVANPAWLVDNLLPYFIDASGAIVQLGSDEEDVERSESVAANELVRPLVDELFDKLIVQPYDLISFGYLLEPECAAARDSHLRSEDWSYRDGDNIRDALRDADCDRAADFNEDATLERLGMALISLLVACIVCVLLIMVAVTVIGSQFVFLAVLALVPLWAVLAIVPGTLRQVGLRGVYTAGRSGIAIPAATFLLTLLLILSSEVLGDETIERLEERWLVLGIGASLLVTHRTALIDLASELVLRATQQLETKDPGGIGASLLSPANLPDSLVRRRFTEKSVDTVYGAMTGFPRRLRRRGGGGGGGLGGTGGGPRRRGRVGTGIAAGVAGLGTAGVAAAIATGGLSVAGLALGGAGALGFIGGAGFLLSRLNGPNYVSPRKRRRQDRREERRQRRQRNRSDDGPEGPNQWPDPRTPDPRPRNSDGRPTPDPQPRRRPDADGRPASHPDET